MKRTGLTGAWLYLASKRALGPARLHPEHEVSWEELQPFWRGYWNRLASMARRKGK